MADTTSSGGGVGKDTGMAVLAHVLGIFTYFVGPLIIYLVTTQEGYTKTQAKEALNFQITLTICYIVSGLLSIIVIGWFIYVAVAIYGLIYAIMAAMACSKGEDWRYPISIRMIK